MNPVAKLGQALAVLDAQHLRRRRRTADSPCAPRVEADGRGMMAFCSNDYLGLANHPCVVAALQEGAARYGAGSGASALISGHTRAHAALEEALAAFMAPCVDRARALYFGCGYTANLAVLQALGGRDAVVFSEALNHASLIDGARLSRSDVQVYPHGDLDALAALMAASTHETKIVATDSVFSMDGDLAPLRELLALCERHGAWLVIDDAHGFGVLGEGGRGALEHLGLKSEHIVYMGTLGKAAGVAGAFVAAHETVVEWLLQRARTYIFTTAPAPALAHSLCTSVDIIGGAEGAARRAHLRTLVAQLRAGLRLSAWRHLPSETAIQPIVIGANDDALHAAAALAERGLWIPAIRPPTVPAGTARLRVTLSAAHAATDVAWLVKVLSELDAAQAQRPDCREAA